MRLQNEFVLNDYIIDLAWSPCSKQIAAVTVEGYVFLVDIEKRLKSCEPIGITKLDVILFHGTRTPHSFLQQAKIQKFQFGTHRQRRNS